jgi:hypothetical protein
MRGSHSSGVEETGAKRCGRGRRGVGVEETGPSRRGQQSGPNTGTECGAGAGGTNLRDQDGAGVGDRTRATTQTSGRHRSV